VIFFKIPSVQVLFIGNGSGNANAVSKNKNLEGLSGCPGYDKIDIVTFCTPCRYV
jgi:hypothetical protein